MDENKQDNPVVNEENNNPQSQEDNKQNPSNPSKEGGEQGNEPNKAVDANKPAEAQTKEENAKFAKLRHERDVAKAKAAGDAEGYKRARIKSVGGKNPYSDNSPIESDEDYEFYELQDEVNSRGLDPKNPLEIEKVRREFAAKKAKELEDKKSEEQKAQDKANQEVKDYLDEGHTQAELQKYWSDTRFQEFAQDLLGSVPLKTIIAKFDKVYPASTEEAKKMAANKISSPGSASNDEQEVPKKKISEMSKDEFDKLYDAVAKGKVKL